MNHDFQLRVARKEEAEAIHQNMVKVYEALEHKEIFVCDDLEWVKQHMEAQGFAVVACDSMGRIAASLIVRYPKDEEDNLGRDIGLPDAELKRVVHMEAAVVLPQYRGQHLQRRLLQYAEEIINKEQYRHFLTTISPENPASYKSIEACGYKIMIIKEKYGGLLRRIYYKEWTGSKE